MVKDLLDPTQIIKIENNNPNLLPTVVVILAVVFIVYAIVSIRYNNRRKIQLKQLKRKIEVRHNNLVSQNERRRRIEEKKIS